MTLPWYSILLVSTEMKSPGEINRGTFISIPFSKIAGLKVFVAVSPFNPGSVSFTEISVSYTHLTLPTNREV